MLTVRSVARTAVAVCLGGVLSACAGASTRTTTAASAPITAAPSVASAASLLPGGCSAAALGYASDLGSITHNFSVASTAAAAAAWAGAEAGGAPSELARWQSAPATERVEFCLVEGTLDQLHPPMPAGVADPVMTFAVIAVDQNQAHLEYAGPSYATLPQTPLPGIAKASIPSFAAAAPAATPSP